MDIEADRTPESASEAPRRKVSLAPPKRPQAPLAPSPVVARPAVEEPAGDDDKPDAPEVKKKELLDQVALQTDMKRGDVRRVVEATLAVIGDALERGDSMAFPPLGKVQVLNSKEANGATIIRTKIRRPKNTDDTSES